MSSVPAAISADQDPRIRPGQCAETTVIAGSEFVCIAPPHPDPPGKKWSLDRAIASAHSPLSRRHFFVRRHP